jgi:hypothetical protein
MPFFGTFSRFQLKISVAQIETNLRFTASDYPFDITLYFQHHMSCFYVFIEIIKEVIVRFVDICEIDDLSLYKLSFYNNTSTYRPSATICVHITVDINDI